MPAKPSLDQLTEFYILQPLAFIVPLLVLKYIACKRQTLSKLDLPNEHEYSKAVLELQLYFRSISIVYTTHSAVISPI